MNAKYRTLLIAAIVVTLLTGGATGFFEDWLSMSRPAGVALCILTVAAVLWVTEAVPLFVTSFLILFLNIVWMVPLLAKTATPVSAARFTAPFFSDVILLFLGGFVLSAAFRRYGVDERLARAVLQRTGDRPESLLMGVMATTAFLSMWMSNTATTAMMLGLAGPLLTQVAATDPFRKALTLGIPFAANIGGLGTPIGTPPNAIAVQVMTQTGSAPSFAAWITMAAPMFAIMLFVTWRLLLHLHPTGLRRVAFPAVPSTEFDARGAFVAAIAVLTIGGWLTSGLHGLSSGTVALVPVITFFSLRILKPADLRQLPWDVLILAGGGLSLGVAASSSGLAAWVVSHVPVGEAPLVIVALGFALVASVMSTFMSNTATANLLIPMAVSLPVGLERPILCLVAFACSASMALPVTTPPNAMAFGSGHIQVRDMVWPGGLATLVGILAAVLSVFWWRLVGVF